MKLDTALETHKHSVVTTDDDLIFFVISFLLSFFLFRFLPTLVLTSPLCKQAQST